MRGDDDRVVGLRQLDCLVPASNGDVLRRLCRCDEFGLERGLVEHRGTWPSRLTRAAPVETQRGVAVGVLPLVGIGRLGELAEAVSEPCARQQARDLVVVVDSTRLCVRCGPTLQNGYLPTILGQVQRRGESYRTCSDDEDVAFSSDVVPL